MIKFFIYFIILALACGYARAEDSVFLNKGDKSPYSGYLLDQSKLSGLKNDSLERDSLKLQNDSLNTSLKLQQDIIDKKDSQIKLYSDQDDSLAKSLQAQQGLNSWERLGFFALGVLVTGLAADAAFHAIQK